MCFRKGRGMLASMLSITAQPGAQPERPRALLLGTRRVARAGAGLALLQGLPTRASPKVKYRDGFLVHRFFLDPIHGALLALCEKVEDCETTTGHVGQIARTLMKDARRGLNR